MLALPYPRFVSSAESLLSSIAPLAKVCKSKPLIYLISGSLARGAKSKQRLALKESRPEWRLSRCLATPLATPCRFRCPAGYRRGLLGSVTPAHHIIPMTTDLDTKISRALAAGAEFEEQSDAAFACGDVVHGSQFFRYAMMAYSHAEELAQRAPVRRHWWSH